MRESELKSAVEDYLQLLMNQGKLYFDRLNSGSVLIVQGESKRRVRLCREGTGDHFVLQGYVIQPSDVGKLFCKVLFPELKGEHGRFHPEQKAFAKLVFEQGADWRVIRSIDDLETALFGDIKLREG